MGRNWVWYGGVGYGCGLVGLCCGGLVSVFVLLWWFWCDVGVLLCCVVVSGVVCLL